MNGDYKKLMLEAARKVLKAINLLEASLAKLPGYDPDKIRTPDEQEPYDALSDRFMRSVETCLKYFLTREYYMYAERSDTVRDLLNRMEKINVISSTHVWMEMRDVRNRIVHDYLPDQIKKFYDLIMYEFAAEIRHTQAVIVQTLSPSAASNQP